MIKRKSLSLLGIIILLLVNFFLLKYSIAKELGMQEIPVAVKTIHPRTHIKKDDIKFIEVPKVFLNDKFYHNHEQIIGLYTDLNTIIPAESLFYKELLFKEEDLPDYPSVLLEENEVAFSMPTSTIKLSGNTLQHNQHVDLLLTIKQKNEKPLVDKLLEGVRIIAIKDAKGLDVNDVNSSKKPAVVVLAIRDEDLNLMRTALEVGELELYAYARSNDKGYKLLKDSKVYQYVK